MKYYIGCLPLIINIHLYKQYRFLIKVFVQKKYTLNRCPKKRTLNFLLMFSEAWRPETDLYYSGTSFSEEERKFLYNSLPLILACSLCSSVIFLGGDIFIHLRGRWARILPSSFFLMISTSSGYSSFSFKTLFFSLPVVKVKVTVLSPYNHSITFSVTMSDTQHIPLSHFGNMTVFPKRPYYRL